MRLILILIGGALFGAGLVVSGMTDPKRVIGFLDFLGEWDPALAFVMGGALCITLPATHFILKLPIPLMARSFSLPKKKVIDAPLVVGAALFGVGWGLGSKPRA